MAGNTGFIMHESGYWFRILDNSGPYVFDGIDMWLGSVANVISAGMSGVIAKSGVVANGIASATIPAVAGKKNYISGFEITGTGATLGAAATAVLSGIVNGPVQYVVAAPAGVLVAVAPLVVTFDPPIPATDVNVAITLSLPALGLGNLNASVVIHGYQI